MEINPQSLSEETNVRDFRQLLLRTVNRYRGQEAYIVKLQEGHDGQPTRYRHVTYGEFWEEIRCFATMLMEKLPKGSHIAVIGENRYEWCLSYLSVACGGNVVVPVDKELKPEEIQMVLEQSHSVAIIYSDKIYQKHLAPALEKVPGVQAICMDDVDIAARGHERLTDCLAKGREMCAGGDNRFDELQIDPYKMSVLIFTSGTTGVAKGVMLSQYNICSDIMSVLQCLDTAPTDSMLSILPMHHTYECTCTFLVTIAIGGRVAFCEGTRYIAKNIQEYKPTIMMLVPLILENVHTKVIKTAKSNPVKYIGFRTLMLLSTILRFFHIDAGRKLFHTVHETMGGRLRLVIAGAAAMSPKVSRDLTRMGFKVRQGYGLTECSPILCVNRESDSKYASVGPAMPGVSIKIEGADEEGRGEILAKGDNIMLGYYENEEATRAVFTEDGWFRTGDQGKMDANGHIYVTGRIKNMIVNKTGKNIYPEELEALLAKIPYVGESIVWGDNSSSDEDTMVCATVVPNADEIRARAKLDPGAINEVEALIWNEVKKINKGLPTWKRIQRIEIRTEEFEKTTTQKVKRYVLNLGRKKE